MAINVQMNFNIGEVLEVTLTIFSETMEGTNVSPPNPAPSATTAWGTPTATVGAANTSPWGTPASGPAWGASASASPAPKSLQDVMSEELAEQLEKEDVKQIEKEFEFVDIR